MKTYQQNENNCFTSSKRTLTRDMGNRKIAGVCSGLGKYFNWDVSIVRISWFLLAFFGIFSAGISTFMVLFAYFLLWLILPKSTTTYLIESKKQ